MTFQELYEYAWFSNLSYVNWTDPDNAGVTDFSIRGDLILAAVVQQKAPETLIDVINGKDIPSGDGLATQIFLTEGWGIPGEGVVVG